MMPGRRVRPWLPALVAAAALSLCPLQPRHARDSVFSLGPVFAPVYFGVLVEGLATGRPWPAVWCLMPAALPLPPVLVRAAQAMTA